MAQIKKKFIGANQVDDTKIQLTNGGFLKGLGNDASTVNILHIRTDNNIAQLDGNITFAGQILDSNSITSLDPTARVLRDASNLTALTFTGTSRTLNASDQSVVADWTTPGQLNMGGNAILNLPAPVNASDPATKGYADGIASGFTPKAAVQVATTGDLGSVVYYNGVANDGVGASITAVANGSFGTLDGYTVGLNDRILVKDQSDTTQNGIYTLSFGGNIGAPWILVRATDNDSTSTMDGGDVTYDLNGAQAGTQFTLVAPNPITVGTTPIEWTTGSMGGANEQLSNLTGTTAVPVDLLPLADISQALGSLGDRWSAVFAGTTVTSYITPSDGSDLIQLSANTFNPRDDASVNLGDGGHRFAQMTAVNTFTDNLWTTGSAAVATITSTDISFNGNVLPITDGEPVLGSATKRWAGINTQFVVTDYLQFGSNTTAGGGGDFSLQLNPTGGLTGGPAVVPSVAAGGGDFELGTISNPFTNVWSTALLTTNLGDAAGNEVAAIASGGPSVVWSRALDLNNANKIINVVDPTSAQDAATKNYVDTHASAGYQGNRPWVTLKDDAASSLPTGTSYQADGQYVVNDDRVLFTGLTPIPISWDNLVNCIVSPTYGCITGNSGGNTFAYSNTVLTGGVGSISFQNFTTSVSWIGLSTAAEIAGVNMSAVNQAIGWGIGTNYPSAGSWSVNETTNTSVVTGLMSPTDIFTVSSDGTTVTYYQNGTLIYTSLVSEGAVGLQAAIAGYPNVQQNSLGQYGNWQLNNEVYVVGGVGTALTWTLAKDGQAGNGTPAPGDILLVLDGTTNAQKQFDWTGSEGMLWSGGWSPLGGGSTTPGGSSGQVQFNSAGTFGGDADLTVTGTNIALFGSSGTGALHSNNGVTIGEGPNTTGASLYITGDANVSGWGQLVIQPETAFTGSSGNFCELSFFSTPGARKGFVGYEDSGTFGGGSTLTLGDMSGGAVELYSNGLPASWNGTTFSANALQIAGNTAVNAGLLVGTSTNLFETNGNAVNLSNNLTYNSTTGWVYQNTAAGSLIQFNSNEIDLFTAVSGSSGRTASPVSIASFTPSGLGMYGNAITSVLDPVNPQDAATKNYVDTTVGTWQKDVITLSPTDITNQYLTLTQQAVTNSILAYVRGGTTGDEGYEYTSSVVSSMTQLAFTNDWATGGATALVSGDIVVIMYQY